MSEVTLTKQQSEAMELIRAWFNEKKEDIFVLSGYAGTGKSFLIKEVINELKLDRERVAFVAPTGKAAEVLLGRGIKASTIHQLIYCVREVEKEEEVNGIKTTKKNVVFEKRRYLDMDYDLIVVDEFSMVSNDIIKDLLSFKVPLLCCGDGEQLAPVYGSNPYFTKPNYTLTDIVRQSAGNPIVQLATTIRSHQDIIPEDYDPDVVRIIKKSEISEEELKELCLEADQILCGRNSTKDDIDKRMRGYKGIDIIKNPLPIKDEKVMILVNNWTHFLDKNKEYNLVNGTIGITLTDSIETNADAGLYFLQMQPNYKCDLNDGLILFDGNYFTKNTFMYDMHEKAMILFNGKSALKKFPKRMPGESIAAFKTRSKAYAKTSRDAVSEVQINRICFAYAITGHKSQGSEWDNVLIFDESRLFGNDSFKWLYTCVTRAKKRVTIIV